VETTFGVDVVAAWRACASVHFAVLDVIVVARSGDASVVLIEDSARTTKLRGAVTCVQVAGDEVIVVAPLLGHMGLVAAMRGLVTARRTKVDSVHDRVEVIAQVELRVTNRRRRPHSGLHRGG
jgi:hypothetical protein